MDTWTRHYIEDWMLFKIQKIAFYELGLARARLLVSRSQGITPQFRTVIEDSEARRLITEQESTNLYHADILLRAQRVSDRKYLYAVGEVAYTVSDDSIKRARDQADALARATSEETVAIVVGSDIQPRQRALAALQGVQVALPAMI